MNKTFLHLVVLTSLFACNSSNNSDAMYNSIEESDTIATETETSNSVDSLINDTAQFKKSSFVDVSNWKPQDFILDKKDKSNQSLINLMMYKQDEWQQVKNPFVATYKGCDFGDYFHLNFEDENGTIYDFGFGANDLGEFELYDEIDFEDNKKYMNKKFVVHWNWVIATFPCCDGEYEQVQAYTPSIVLLEPL